MHAFLGDKTFNHSIYFVGSRVNAGAVTNNNRGETSGVENYDVVEPEQDENGLNRLQSLDHHLELLDHGCGCRRL